MLRSSIKAVAFDAFGTLVDIHDKRRPYAKLAASALAVVKSPMTRCISLEDYAVECNPHISGEYLSELSSDLEDELASTYPFAESTSVLTTLIAAGIRTAVASNLAFPYAYPVQAHLGQLLDEECWSFEVGTVKPDLRFYASLCTILRLNPSEILMVGDTWRSDFLGASAAGLHALHLERNDDQDPDVESICINNLVGVLHRLDLV